MNVNNVTAHPTINISTLSCPKLERLSSELMRVLQRCVDLLTAVCGLSCVSFLFFFFFLLAL